MPLQGGTPRRRASSHFIMTYLRHYRQSGAAALLPPCHKLKVAVAHIDRHCCLQETEELPRGFSRLFNEALFKVMSVALKFSMAYLNWYHSCSCLSGAIATSQVASCSSTQRQVLLPAGDGGLSCLFDEALFKVAYLFENQLSKNWRT